MPKLMITGGSGYLGAELTRLALADGDWDVVSTYYSQPIVAHPRAIRLDIRNSAAVAQLIGAEQPDVIIHTAYLQDGPNMWATTAEGAGYVAWAAFGVGARLIHVSSDALFDGTIAGRYRDDALPSPITPYGRAKTAAEQFVLAAHPEALIVRTSLIYGGMLPSKYELMVRDAIHGGAHTQFFADELRNPIQVTDLGLALLELTDRDLSGTINIAGADTVSRYTFACLIAGSLGLPVHSLVAGLSTQLATPRPRNCALDIRLAQSMLRTRLRGVYQVLA